MTSCLDYNDLGLSAFNDIYADEPSCVGLHVITISEPGPSDEFEISGKIFERPFINASMKQMSGPDVIDGIYWIHFPDDETLFIIIDDLKGNIHLISNDCLYMQYAMTKYVFRDREHFHQYHGECNIEHLGAAYDADSETERCYFYTFVKEMKSFYLLKDNGINLF